MNGIQRAIEAAGGPSEVAKRLGVTAQAVAFWRDGDRRFPPEHAAPLEDACNGAVTRREMFPDTWHVIWPELVSKKHPAPITAAQA